MENTVNTIVVTFVISLLMSIILGYFSKYELKKLWIAGIIIAGLFFLIQYIFPVIEIYSYSCSVKGADGWWTDCGGSTFLFTITIPISSIMSTLFISPRICRKYYPVRVLIIFITTSIIVFQGYVKTIH